jgi:hypothetical protein
MIMDTQSMFSGTIAADGTRTPQGPVTATAISTNVMDLRQPNGTPALVDNGILGQDLYLVVQCIQAFNNLTSLTITLESDSTANLATAPVVHYSSGPILLAALTANTVLVRVMIPSGNFKRFLGLRYTVAGTAPAAGTLFGFLTLDPQRNVAYPPAFTLDV